MYSTDLELILNPYIIRISAAYMDMEFVLYFTSDCEPIHRIRMLIVRGQIGSAIADLAGGHIF